jgi:hypothetical protein
LTLRLGDRSIRGVGEVQLVNYFSLRLPSTTYLNRNTRITLSITVFPVYFQYFYMEEYLSYSMSPQGQLFPVVSIVNPLSPLNENKPVYRDLGREDLLRIPDDNNIPGGWLYKRGTSTSSNSTLNAWTRRFAILRGSYLFFFHNPQSDKPLFIIPLSGCDIVLPPNDAKTFDDTAQRRVFKANDGYEFEIRAKNDKYPPIRLYSLFEQERDEWVSSIQDRCFDYDDIAHEINSLNDDDGRISEGAPAGGMVFITKTKLLGDSPVAADRINSADMNSKRLFSDAAAPASSRVPMTTLTGNIVTYSPFSNPTPGITEAKVCISRTIMRLVIDVASSFTG